MNINDKRLLLLMRNALFGVPMEETLFADASNEDWDELYKQAQCQGVLALACDAILSMSKENRPYDELFLKWILMVKASEKRYKKQCQAAVSLCELYAQNGIKMLIIKGIGVSLFYPVPQHRDCGDIDIWLYGENRKGDALIKSQGIQIFQEKKHEVKHTSFCYQGICVENHRHLLDKRSVFKNNAAYERKIFSYLEREGTRTQSYGLTTLNFPPVMFDALYLMAHISSHIIGRRGIALRYLCDWTLFLYRNYTSINFDELCEAFEQSDRLMLARSMTVIAVNELCLPKQCAGPLYCPEQSMAEELLEDRILRPKYRAVTSRNVLSILSQKMRRVGINRKIYQRLFGKSFARRYALGAYLDRLFNLTKLFSTPQH